MANTFKLKQSAVSAKIPTTAQLQLGELAVNTHDGRLFTKKNVSGTESIIEFVSNSGTWGISINGNAATATTLQNARTINGASFNGSADITTASWGTTRTLTIGNTGKSVDGSAAVSWSLAEIGAFPAAGGTMSGDLYADGASRKLGRFTVLQSGYLDFAPLNFRFDQDCLRYANRWGTATITATAFTANELDSLFSQYTGVVNLQSKASPCSIEITNINLGSSANFAFYPYVLLHAGNQLGSIKMELLKSGAPTTWEIAYNGAVPSTGYVIAEYSSGNGNLIGVRWTFSGYTANPHYIRSIGCISRNGQGYAWNVMKGGDTVYGNLVVAAGYSMTAPQFVSNVATGTAPLGVTSTTVCTNLNADLLDGLHESTIVHGAGTPSASRYAPVTWVGTEVTQYKSGFWDVSGASWMPTTDWWWGMTLAHTSNSSSYLYGGQLAIRNGAGQDIYVRHLYGGANPAAGAWHRIWTSGSDGSGSGLDADLLDGYHVGTSGGTIPLLNAANTWSALQTLTAGIFLSAHNGTAPTAMFLHDGSNKLYLLLSDSGSAPSSTYNSLRPFSVDLTTGAVTMAQGVTITNGLTLTGGASITGGLSAYSATNDYTQATVKFGRNSNAYIALHGHSSGNYITHVATDANPDPFRIALKTETLSWEHVFAMDGYIVPSQGLRWGTTGVAPPTTSTRSEGTKLVLYPGLGASTVDHAIGVNTQTQWYSIPQQSSRCFKWYAGITPIAALHGDGNHFVYDPGPTTQNTSVTLTDAQIRTCIIQSTPTAGITLTLPTSTNMNDTLWDGGTGMDWSVINLATDGTKTVTLAGNTNHTIVGNAVVAINSSARFRTLKSIYEQNGLPVFTTYRIS